ncbi:hypothetical protein [Microbacterium yannicii]|uniref:hypothetical protein n=1 Tax=Microbacterium yannicii TaxID=671622 RepID=UPI0002ED346C|nr:hypothetical protein [Microbacterium yannicii]
MNLADTIRVLVRRWYLTLPVLILAFAGGIGAFLVVEPTYERTAKLLMLPDTASIPAEANPYLYLSGLSPVADVLTRASGSQQFLDEVTEGVPGGAVSITRDFETASPVIVITASALADEAAALMVDETIDHVTDTLEDLQTAEGIADGRRLSIQTLTVDTAGTVVQRTRLLATGLAVAAGLLLAIVLPALVEGLTRRRRRMRAASSPDAEYAHSTPTADGTADLPPDDVDERLPSAPGPGKPKVDVPGPQEPAPKETSFVDMASDATADPPEPARTPAEERGSARTPRRPRSPRGVAVKGRR